MPIAINKSQIKVSKLLLNPFKDSVPYIPSIWIYMRKFFLEDRFIDFANSCEEITDKGLKSLSEGLKTLSSLHSLNLDFYA